MANHAYVVPDVMPTPDQITECLREFVARRFPQFRVETWENNEGPGWMVIAGDEADQVLVLCWLEPETVDMGKVDHTREYTSEEFEDLPTVPCIEFTHGHAWPFLWWIEDELHTALLTAFPGRQWDDGVGELLPMHEPALTYFDYLKRRWLDYEKAVAIQAAQGGKRKSAEELDTRRRVDLFHEGELHAGLPADVIPLMGFPDPREKLEITYEQKDGRMIQTVKVIK